MTTLKKQPASVAVNGRPKPAPPAQEPVAPWQLSTPKIKELVGELEVPFHPSLIEWQVTNVSEDERRGRIMPYADPRAYIDRLNGLLTPVGWTRKYSVTTSPNFERSEDHKLVSKVFVTCEVTIFGIGSHAATGEEWTDDDNAGTSAEAQAFKRACSCFGLGRYFYSFGEIWVDLNERQRPMELPELHGWATSEGWRKGLRPALPENSKSSQPAQKQRHFSPKEKGLIQQIETMAETLGTRMYRGILKQVAKVWNPSEIQDTASLERVLTSMQSAEHSLGQFEAARGKIDPETLQIILRSLNLKSVDHVDSLEMLQKLVSAAEEKAAQLESA